MFVHIESRRRAGPRWVTPLLVAACVASYLALALTPPIARLAAVMRWGSIPADLLHPLPSPWGVATLLAGLRLFSALFIHADLLHLAGNLLFLLGGALANLGGALSLPSAHGPIIGCSGAVSAVVGAYLALFPRARLGLVLPLGAYLEFVRVPAALLIGLWFLLQVLFTYVGPGFGAVVWWAHIVGFCFGILFALASHNAVARRLRG